MTAGCNSAVGKQRHLGHRAGRFLCTPDHLVPPVHCLIKHTPQEQLFLETCPWGGELSMNILPGAAKWMSVRLQRLCSAPQSVQVISGADPGPFWRLRGIPMAAAGP